jgi:phage baseplate assembly protein W
MSTSDLIGSGWSFPCRLNPGGAVALVSGGDELDAALRMIIGTRLGERVMRPEFGCAVWDYVFDPLTPQTLGLIEYAVREAINRWEPRIDLDVVAASVSAEEGVVTVDIGYRVRATNDYRNLVYPFYAIPREAGPT